MLNGCGSLFKASQINFRLGEFKKTAFAGALGLVKGLFERPGE